MKARLPKGFGPQNAGKLMKQYQKMQEDIQNTSAELEAREYSVTSGGGQIELTLNGKYEVVSLKIKPEVVDPDDIEMLEDLLTAAMNEGVRIVKETSDNAIDNITSGLSIPAGLL